MSKRQVKVSGVAGLDPVLPDVSITVKGVEYHLVFDFNAIAQVEDLTGKSLLTVFSEGSLNASKIRALLYAALLSEHPDMTLEAAGKLVTLKNMNDIIEKIMAAWQASQAEAEDQESPNE